MASNLTPEYIAILRSITGAQKLRVAFQMYWGARRLKAARLRQQHPDWSEEQVQQRVKEILCLWLRDGSRGLKPLPPEREEEYE